MAILIPRLASDKPGEVAATAAAITRQLRKAGADWHDLAAALVDGHAHEPQHRHRARAEPDPDPDLPDGFASYLDAVRWLLAERADHLTPKQYAFLNNMLHRIPRRQPTPKQAAWIVSLVDHNREGW